MIKIFRLLISSLIFIIIILLLAQFLNGREGRRRSPMVFGTTPYTRSRHRHYQNVSLFPDPSSGTTGDRILEQLSYTPPPGYRADTLTIAVLGGEAAWGRDYSWEQCRVGACDVIQE